MQQISYLYSLRKEDLGNHGNPLSNLSLLFHISNFKSPPLEDRRPRQTWLVYCIRRHVGSSLHLGIRRCVVLGNDDLLKNVIKSLFNGSAMNSKQWDNTLGKGLWWMGHPKTQLTAAHTCTAGTRTGAKSCPNPFYFHGFLWVCHAFTAKLSCS